MVMHAKRVRFMKLGACVKINLHGSHGPPRANINVNWHISDESLALQGMMVDNPNDFAVSIV